MEHDWLLPIGYLFPDVGQNEEAPMMTAVMWFRGDMDNRNLAAYVFYKGKQICGKNECGMMHPVDVGTPGMLPDPKWQRWVFAFSSVRLTNNTSAANNYSDNIVFLDKNPGEYESRYCATENWPEPPRSPSAKTAKL